jgi:heme-degrading monooxygenase HmoA
LWSARTTIAQAPAYARYLENHVFPELRGIDGYLGARLLERSSAGDVELLVITEWQSLESIRQFSGEDLERAVVSAEAATLLTDFDPRARHFVVVAADRVADSSSKAGE